MRIKIGFYSLCFFVNTVAVCVAVLPRLLESFLFLIVGLGVIYISLIVHE